MIPVTWRMASASASNPVSCCAQSRGVQLVELAESDLCCGSAGSYNLTQRAMARELVARKADNIIATGAEYVALSNPGCQFQIAAELKRRGSLIRLVHLADFLALAVSRNTG
jgi:glycolate oxidase iron-sulfur subunit